VCSLCEFLEIGECHTSAINWYAAVPPPVRKASGFPFAH